MKPVHWKLVLICAVLAWAIFQAFPRAERPFMNMNLGLDLKGGSYLVMKVVTDDAVKSQSDIRADFLAETLRKKGFGDVRGTVGDAISEVVLTGIPVDRLAEAEKVVSDNSGDWSVDVAGDTIRARMPLSEQNGLRDQAVRQALSTIENRINEFGVAETSVARVGGKNNDRILVQLPGVEDPSRVKRVLQTQARLELRLAYYAPDGAGPYRGLTKEDVLTQFGGQPPAGVEILPVEEKQRDEVTGAAPAKKIAEWMAIEKSAVITGADLQNAQRGQDQWSQPAVDFSLRVSAVDRFSKFTGDNINRAMPIVLDGRIISAPVIHSQISSHGQISGRFTAEEAEDLALGLRAGALPARVNTIEERTVGPSLGRDSIQSGVRAAMLGAALVCVFMVIYYRLSGINALIALAFNLLIVAAAMATFGATLTLPGIGGYALTVGMAVDANVLIFERIREEMRMGKTVRGAIDAGFSKALSAIIDSNLTTLIAALMLLNYGTGPVRGFAVALSIGLVANVFTAVFVSKVIFELALGDRAVQRLSI